MSNEKKFDVSGGFVDAKDVAELDRNPIEIPDHLKWISKAASDALEGTDKLLEVMLRLEKQPLGSFAVFEGRCLVRTADPKYKVQELNTYVKRLELAAIAVTRKLEDRERVITSLNSEIFEFMVALDKARKPSLFRRFLACFK